MPKLHNTKQPILTFHAPVAFLIFLCVNLCLLFLQTKASDFIQDALQARWINLLSGLVIVCLIGWQGWASYQQHQHNPSDASTLALHQWIGTLIVLVIVWHAGSFGTGLSLILTLCMMCVIASGFLQPYVFQHHEPTLQIYWRCFHIGMSGAVIPLILLHLWANLAFKAV